MTHLHAPLQQAAPPVMSWPEKAFADESPVGFFRRLADVNGQESCRPFAQFVGVNFRNPNPTEIAEFASLVPSLGSETLKDNAWTRGVESQRPNKLLFRGHVFSEQRDFTVNRPQVCPICLHEEYYYRAWFDLKLIQVCPHHGVALIDGIDGESFANWVPRLDQTPSGKQLAASARTVERVGDYAFERYLLNKLSYGDFDVVDISSNPPLSDVVYASGAIGRLMSTLNSESPNKSIAHTVHEIREGFSLLKKDTDEALSELIFELSNFKYEHGTRKALKVFNECISKIFHREFQNQLRQMSKRASVFGASAAPMGRLAHVGKGPNEFTLGEAYSELGMSKKSGRRLFNRLGYCSKQIQNPGNKYITEGEIQKIRNYLNSCLTLSEAAQKFGLNKNSFGRFKYVRLIEAVPSPLGEDLYDENDIEKIMSDIRKLALDSDFCGIQSDEYCRKNKISAARLIHQILDGVIEIRVEDSPESFFKSIFVK